MTNREKWITFFGNIVKDITGIDNVLLDIGKKVKNQEKNYPKIRFSIDEVEANTTGIFKKDRKIPSQDINFFWDIERTTRYFPKWLCTINFYGKVDNESLEKLGRLLLDRRRFKKYILKHYPGMEEYKLYKSSSISRVKSNDLSGYEHSQSLYHKRLTVEFVFEVIEREVIESIEKVEVNLETEKKLDLINNVPSDSFKFSSTNEIELNSQNGLNTGSWNDIKEG